RVGKRLEYQLPWRFEFPGNKKLLSAWLGDNLCLVLCCHNCRFLVVFISFTCLLFHLLQEIIQPAELPVPQLPVPLDPVRYLIQLTKTGLTIPFPALLLDNDQPTLGEDLDMLRDSRPADIEILRYGIQVQRLISNQIDDLPPRRVGYRLKYIS